MQFPCHSQIIMSSLRFPVLLALLMVALLAAGPALQAQTPVKVLPTPTPPAGKVEPVHVNGQNLPPFLAVDSLYVLNGNEDDMVRVLELSDTGWMRVQSKAGESWVNVHNLTIITPVSKETAAKTESHQKADFIRDGAQSISDAIDAYATKNNLAPTASFKWKDIRPFLMADTTIHESNGKDVTGRPYVFGTKIEDHVKVSPDTIREFSPIIDDPDAYWGKFKP